MHMLYANILMPQGVVIGVMVGGAQGDWSNKITLG